MPLPVSAEEQKSVVWLDSQVVVGEGADRLLVDPSQRAAMAFPGHLESRIAAVYATRAKEAAAKQATEALGVKIGGKAGVTWHRPQ